MRLNTVVIVAGVVWLIVAWLNYRQYLVSLVGMLDSRVIDFDDESDVLMDSRFDSQLRVSLAKASDFEAGFLADLIIGMHRPDWCPEFRAMLDKPDVTLQRAGVRYLVEFGNAADHEHMVAVGLANSLLCERKWYSASAPTAPAGSFGCFSRFWMIPSQRCVVPARRRCSTPASYL